MAILAGDALLSHAFEYIGRETKGVDADKVLRVIVDVGKCVGSEGLVGGQVVDILSEGAGPENVTIETLQYIHAHKTGALLEVSVTAGAILGARAKSRSASSSVTRKTLAWRSGGGRYPRLHGEPKSSARPRVRMKPSVRRRTRASLVWTSRGASPRNLLARLRLN